MASEMTPFYDFLPVWHYKIVPSLILGLLFSSYWTTKNIVTFKHRLGVTRSANLCTT